MSYSCVGLAVIISRRDRFAGEECAKNGDAHRKSRQNMAVLWQSHTRRDDSHDCELCACANQMRAWFQGHVERSLVKLSRAFQKAGQAVKADFWRSRILTPVANGPMRLIGVTTP